MFLGFETVDLMMLMITTAQSLHWIATFAFLVALAGSASSTVFLGMTVVALFRHLRRRAKARRAVATVHVRELPPVTLLKPVHGSEPRLMENLESFFRQDYPNFEIIFGARTVDNPALRAVELLRAKYPSVKARVVLSGEP